jgi:hypothetical protein
LVPVFVTVTLTPGIKAPDESLTTPLMEPVISWADALPTQRERSNNPERILKAGCLFIKILLLKKRELRGVT